MTVSSLPSPGPRLNLVAFGSFSLAYPSAGFRAAGVLVVHRCVSTI